MSRWVSESEISAQLGYKILIGGLSEAGKTAVKRIFFLKQQTEDVNKLAATINYERMALTVNDVPVTIVDLGGQKIFLKRFLSGFSPFIFSSVKVFIFLIDVANKTSRNNAIQYFTSCLEKLKKFSPDSNIFVFLHKNDLIRNSPNYESIHEQFKEQFQIESSNQLKFFRTTIYRPESVIDAFGRIFEVSIPELAKSDFVSGRFIGEIEEHHEIVMTLADKTVSEVPSSPTVLHARETDEDPAILEKLQFIMKQSLKSSNGVSDGSNIFLSNAASEESISETILTHRDLNQEDMASVGTPSVPDEIRLKKEPQFAPTDNLVEINHLLEFYRISIEEATELIKNGWNQVFEMAVTSGIPVPLVSDILLKYLPFIEKSQGQEKFRSIDHNKLLGLFSVILKGELKEENIVKCLALASEKPKLSIREIVSKYLVPEVPEVPEPEVPEVTEVKIEPKKREEIEKKPVEYTHFDVPIEFESSDGMIALPNTQGMGFKIDLTNDDYNARISFQLQSTMGQKELIGSSLVSVDATEDEILYLLAYEKNFLSLGFFEDGISSMTFAAKVIHESIRQLKSRKLSSTKEVQAKRIRGETGIRADMVKFIIPTEVKTEGNCLILPDSENVAFSLESNTKGFILSFTQRGFPIGQAHISESITEYQLSRLLKEPMQLPIESDSSIDFASRIIYVAIKNLLYPKEISKKETVVTTVKQDDKTSDTLKEYLELLITDDDTF